MEVPGFIAALFTNLQAEYSNITFGSPDKDVFLLEKLTTEEELSGLLKLAIIGLRQLTKEGRFNHIEDIRGASNHLF